jgi:CRISPR-associated protein Cmr2
VIPASKDEPPMFPFDILLIGGDDVMLVTPASLALDVACTIAKTFYEQTQGEGPNGKGYTLSIGVVLAPVKYPFGMLQDLVESTLKFAKKASTKNPPKTTYGNTVINFMTVTGSNSLNFNKVYDTLHEKHGRVDGRDAQFYATLRPYSVEELTELLTMIREGRQKRLGRTKLHQIREAVLRMNLTTSVSEGLAVLSNWRGKQREFVVEEFYKLAGRHQKQHRDLEKPGTLFQRVTFPWFADGPHTYRTPLLDFVELYDFVAQEEVEDAK